MGRIVAATAALVLLIFFQNSAHAFVDPPVLVPTNPVAGQTVSINVTAGDCDVMGGAPPVVSIQGSNIHVLLQSGHSIDPEFCTFPTFTASYVIGSFGPGSYVMQVDRTYLGDNGTVTETIGTLAFTVTALAGTPTLGGWGRALLLCAFLTTALIALRRRRMKFLALALVFELASPSARAQIIQPSAQPTIEVLLSARSGAPTADSVVSYLNAGRKGTAPLASLSVESPQGSAYLLPIRATGDFLTAIQNNPDWSRAKLERYVVIRYSPSANLQNALAALRSDPSVDAAYISASTAKFSSATLIGFGVTPSGPGAAPLSNGPQYGRDDLNVDAAWQLAGGYALIGDVDTGLDTSHPALMQFASNGQYLGGPFVPAGSLNIGFSGTPGYSSTWSDPNVDELYPLPASSSNTVCNPNNLTAIPPAYAGHGTHVAGLIAANPNSSLGVMGTCKHCGLAEWKVTYPFCAANGKVYPLFNSPAVPASITYLSDTGAQIINLSLGDSTKGGGYCTTNPNDSWCLAVTYASYRDVTIVASAGNNRVDIQFPANDARVLDAGGFEQSLALWDLSPGSTTNCPPKSLTGEPLGDECGSNYQTAPAKPPQELMASANQVLSTTYPQYNWNLIGCGDGYPGPGWGNGVGLCTGTSMSAPQISGVAGILRSINPLVLTSAPAPGGGQPVGIRTVLAHTTFEVQGNPNYFSTSLGYGHPDAAAAARTMMGTVAGRQVLNRVTPLFRLYSSGSQDYADTTTPQFATALMIDQPADYIPQGQVTPGYASFPPAEPGQPALPAPKAAVYVLTTEYTPWPNYPSLIPLYLLDCLPGYGDPGFPACTKSHRDFMLASTTVDVQQAHQGGYSLRATVGYIYKACSPIDCIPPGAQKFYRECNTSVGDCATFLESERASFEAAGYTSAYPVGSSKVLGYAYPNVDSDGDGLVDGMEYVIGTNPNRADSDGNGVSDGSAYPQAGVPVSDPCVGVGAVTFNCPAKDFIFANGFQ